MKIYKNLLYFLVLLYFILSPLSVHASNSINSWNNTTPLPVQSASHISFVYNDKLHVIGGANSISVNLSISSYINPDGSLSEWINSSVKSPPIYWHSYGLYNNYIYLLGGSNFTLNSISNTVYYGTIDNLGNISSWHITQPLPKNLSRGETFVIGNRIYFAGGEDQYGVKSQHIYVSNINSNGTLTTWTVAGFLPYPVEGFNLINSNDAIIIVGGNTDSGYTNKVWRSDVTIDGTIQLWSPLPSLPYAVYRGSSVITDNKLIVAGGISNNGLIKNEIYIANLDINGNFESWNLSNNSLPRPNCCSPLSKWNNHLYLTGGHDGGYYSEVLHSEITNISEIDLQVPNIKQTSEPWQGNIYDSADIWSPTNPTINRWGCALTSVTMLLNYHGLLKITPSLQLNPETLNNWLKTQNDGYIRNGLINWLAISRLSKQIKSYNPGFQFQGLEYIRVNGMNNTIIDNDLNSGLPNILEVQGHFIVVKGKTESTYKINDPFYVRTLLSEGYNDSYLSIRKFIPSNTDLSYIMIEVDKDIQITLKNPNNDSMGVEYDQQPIMDLISNSTSGLTVKILEFPKPDSGRYSLILSSDNILPYSLNVYFYDKEGNVKRTNFSGKIIDGIDQLNIEFSKENSNNSLVNKVITFNDILNNIELAENDGYINNTTAVLLKLTILNAEKEYNKNKLDLAVKQINLFKKIIIDYHKNENNNPTLDLLLSDIDILKNNILIH